jgi:hypothetical protein
MELPVPCIDHPVHHGIVERVLIVGLSHLFIQHKHTQQARHGHLDSWATKQEHR